MWGLERHALTTLKEEVAFELFSEHRECPGTAQDETAGRQDEAEWVGVAEMAPIQKAAPWLPQSAPCGCTPSQAPQTLRERVGNSARTLREGLCEGE